MPAPDLLTTREAAARAGVHIRTIHRWVEDGHLSPFHKIPGGTGAYLFTPDAVDLAVVRRDSAPRGAA